MKRIDVMKIVSDYDELSKKDKNHQIDKVFVVLDYGQYLIKKKITWMLLNIMILL